MVLKPEYASWRSVMLDSQNRFRITSLFWETRGYEGNLAERYPPLFTTKAVPHKVGKITYPSLKAIYMSYDHVPGCEYEFAIDVFGSWDHWVKLTESSLKDMFQGWRDELGIKLKCEALKKLIAISSQESSQGVAASRYLADEGYVAKKVGRVTKEEKARAIKQAANVRETLQDDMARLGLEVVNGGK